MLAETLQLAVRAAPALREPGELVGSEHQERDDRDDGEMDGSESG